MGWDMWHYESLERRNGHARIAGVDEAGRGPLAGPVIAAAVILPENFKAPGLTDSKKLSARQRQRFWDQIKGEAEAVGIGIVSAAAIDRINILQATRLAMARAVHRLDPQPTHVLIDGNQTIDIPISQQAIVKGDALSLSIAAASVVAKVLRDRIMARYHRPFPAYGFSAHKGYPTKAHRDAIRRHGACPIHRLTFRGVRENVPSETACNALFPGV